LAGGISKQAAWSKLATIYPFGHQKPKKQARHFLIGDLFFQSFIHPAP
jgi:hypothetical protein